MIKLSLILLSLLVSVPSIGASNLESCNGALKSLLRYPITQSRSILIGSNQILVKGFLYPYWEQGMEKVNWSVFEEELQHAYKNSIFAVHEAKIGDRIIIKDPDDRFVIAEGFYYEDFREEVIEIFGLKMKRMVNNPHLYVDRRYSELAIDDDKLMQLFHDGNPAYLVKRKERIPEEILKELIDGKKRYDEHFKNPNRFREIIKGYEIELKPNHELEEVKIHKEINTHDNMNGFIDRDERFKDFNYFFVNKKDYIVQSFTSVYVVIDDEVYEIDSFSGYISDEIAQIALDKPQKIFVERRIVE